MNLDASGIWHANGDLAVQGQLKSANVGDSGFLIVGRGGNGEQHSIKYHSPQQEHSFGCPYQLGHYEGADSPEDAMLMTVPVGYAEADSSTTVPERAQSMHHPMLSSRLSSNARAGPWWRSKREQEPYCRWQCRSADIDREVL